MKIIKFGRHLVEGIVLQVPINSASNSLLRIHEQVYGGTKNNLGVAYFQVVVLQPGVVGVVVPKRYLGTETPFSAERQVQRQGAENSSNI
jgi:hypothetical protein